MNPTTEPGPLAAGKKPRLALLLATGFGLGYLPLAPGTWGSLARVALAWGFFKVFPSDKSADLYLRNTYLVVASAHVALLFAVAVALVGIWAAGRAERYLGEHDPQVVVIDELSGQHLTSLVGVGWSVAPGWKYLLLGFILFRVFDIWKPFPVRQAERLRDGWGIMADDWVAGLYAALGLWLARALGL